MSITIESRLKNLREEVESLETLTKETLDDAYGKVLDIQFTISTLYHSDIDQETRETLDEINKMTRDLENLLS